MRYFRIVHEALYFFTMGVLLYVAYHILLFIY